MTSCSRCQEVAARSRQRQVSSVLPDPSTCRSDTRVQPIQASPFHPGLGGRTTRRIHRPSPSRTCCFPLRLSRPGRSDGPGPGGARWPPSQLGRRPARYCNKQPFSNRPPPNRACGFHRTRLSSNQGFLVSAIGIAPTFTSTIPSRLTPFALRTAFPPSDYYGVSVAVGVSPFRQSRVPSAADVIRTT
jgi:hypothetical protein